jgi:hypothetical protein
MEIKKEKIIRIALTLAEREDFESVYDVLADIMLSCGKRNKLISVETGEVIGMDEIPRVLGILSGFMNCSAWTLE